MEFEFLGLADEDLGSEDLEEETEVMRVEDEGRDASGECEVVVWPRDSSI